jgi:ABC-type multidrug transport system fused ATPase/permease subunit
MRSVPPKATTYIYSVLVIGAAVLLEGLHDWSPDWRRFLIYICLTMLGAALKVRLPGMHGTFSLGFVFVLASMLDLNYSETVILGAIAAVVQSLWRSNPRPKPIQVLFNVASFMVTISVCSVVLQLPFLSGIKDNVAAELAMLTCVFFMVNTLLVAGIIAILQDKDMWAVWQVWFMWSFPYYLIGSTIAGLAVATGRAHGRGTSLVFLPIMFFLYAYYRVYMERQRKEVKQ